MARTPLQVSSLNHETVKQSLIDFLRATGQFDDFDFEGSAINTLVDLLVRNSQYDAFLANMVASESFIQSAQMRPNVVSHAQKLSYNPKSTTASRLICNIEVVPADTTNVSGSIVMETGTQFITTINGVTYTFVNIEPYTLSFSSLRGTYKVEDVYLYQGQLIQNVFSYAANTSIEIPNSNVDTSTLKLVTDEATSDIQYKIYEPAVTVKQLTEQNNVFFVSENSRGLFEISFGRDVLGAEPDTGSEITCTYIATEENHGNAIKNLNPASTIAGYSNINVDVTTRAYGGSDKEDLERIRHVAPKAYAAQDRALTSDDYVTLLKQQFSFVDNAISWGGEVADPPRYGAVFISILSNQGNLLTTSVKNQMVQYLSSKNVGSITPIIVDPEFIYINLDILFSFDNRLTNKQFNELSIEIKNIARSYSDTRLNDFGDFYNQSRLIDHIMGIRGITSVEITKKIYKTITKYLFDDPVYLVSFKNRLVPGSILATDFEIASNGYEHKLYDDTKGNIIVSYKNNAAEVVTKTVGNVDYDEGDISFTINMIQDTSTPVKVFAETVLNNVYPKQNGIMTIDEIDTEQFITSERNEPPQFNTVKQSA